MTKLSLIFYYKKIKRNLNHHISKDASFLMEKRNKLKTPIQLISAVFGLNILEKKHKMEKI